MEVWLYSDTEAENGFSRGRLAVGIELQDGMPGTMSRSGGTCTAGACSGPY